MKKILMVSCDGLGNGGVQTVMMQIVRSLKTEFIFDALLFTNEVRYFDEEFLSYGGKIFRMPRYIKNNPILARCDVYFKYFLLYGKMKRLFKENCYDAIHCNNAYEAAICLKAAKKAGIKIRISHQHTEYSPANVFDKFLNRIYKKMLLKNATHLVGASHSSCVSYFGDGADFKVINNPYDEEKFKYTDFTYNSPVFVQVGNYGGNKNQVFSLKVFKKILKKYPDAVLHLVGSGNNEYASEIEKYIEDNNIQNNVFQYGAGTNVYDVLSKAGIFLMPSFKEGFGIVLIEAQAVGLNCYASDTIPPLTNVGGCTYLSLDDGADAWALKITDDIENGRIYRQKYNTDGFKTKNVVEEYKKIYGGN